MILCLDHEHVYPKRGKELIFWGDRPWYGVELEVEFADLESWRSAATRLEGSFGRFLWLTTDESLGEFGLEIVTQPLSMDHHRNIWPDLMTLLRECGARVTVACGVHIHIDRRGMTRERQVTLHDAVCDPARRDQVLAIAGRPPNYHCMFHHPFDAALAAVEKRLAVNFLHKNTLEIRVFASMLDAKGMLGYLSWVETLTDD